MNVNEGSWPAGGGGGNDDDNGGAAGGNKWMWRRRQCVRARSHIMMMMREAGKSVRRKVVTPSALSVLGPQPPPYAIATSTFPYAPLFSTATDAIR